MDEYVKLHNADPAGNRTSGRRTATEHHPDGHDHPAETEQRSSRARHKPRGGRRSTGRIRQDTAQRGRRSAQQTADRGGAPERAGRSSDGSRRATRVRKPRTVDRVSRFSASALRKVTVLGDRPEQVVYTLAEQSRQKHGTYVLITLLVMAVISLLALLAALVFQVLNPQAATNRVPAPIVEPPPGHSTLRPELFHAQDQQDIFDPIAERAADAEPLTEEEIFGSVEELSLGGMDLTLRDSEVTDTCTALVWGEELAQTLSTGACTSAARGVYQDGNGEYVAQFTLFDLADAEAASATLRSLDSPQSPGFVLPMLEDVEGLHTGYSQATAQAMGHYVAVFWVARADGAEPSGDDSMATLNVAAMDAALVVYEQVRDAKEGEKD
ncbi:hypothetical protein FOF52_02690 [Thermobifida alba]|uniref:Uncharacterized protein n=1 Tax=Thermobifida alba TaxID=53522 RepID=A0ABY4L1C3_THEAE|nr:hypothetical protein [Thermobifida alba]UPT20015.1 hypothetical protein FOF52_02690 [Thermobifida alba]